jgi:excisionase family DNA binding protein
MTRRLPHEDGPVLGSHPLDTEVYRIQEVAEALKLSVKTIRRAIQKGELEARKTGKQYLITKEAVQRYWNRLPYASAVK